jgi:hypothetical protein
MALANYIKTCAKNTPGNAYEVYIAPTGTTTAVAETSGEISTLTAAIDTFMKVQADMIPYNLLRREHLELREVTHKT